MLSGTKNLAVFTIFIALLTVNITFATNSLELSTVTVVYPEQNVTITGDVANTTTSDTIQNINFTFNVTSTSAANSTLTNSTGGFALNVSAPTTIGEYNITMTTNSSSLQNRTYSFYASNISNITWGSIKFVNKQPPFTAGEIFTINVTYGNSTYSPLVFYAPRIKVYAKNGAENGTLSGWTIVNITPATRNFDLYNITVPSTADGEYVIVADYVIYATFSIKSGAIISVATATVGSDSGSANFAPNSTINVVAKVRDLDGDPITDVSNITAHISFPNGTAVNFTLTARDQTAYPGYYNTTYTLPTNLTGQYEITVEAGVNNTISESATVLNVKTFNVRIEPEQQFGYWEFGGKSSFRTNARAGLNIIVTNLTDDNIMTTSAGASGQVNCTTVNITNVWNVANGTAVTIVNNTLQSTFMTNSICMLNFTTPASTGRYGVRVNVTVGNTWATTDGYVTVSNYLLKTAAVSSTGGGYSYFMFGYPGSNLTFQLSAYDLANDAAATGDQLSNIKVTKVTQMNYLSGSVDVANVTTFLNNSNYTITPGTSTDNPTVNMLLPNVAGNMIVEFEATIGGEIVTGTAFYWAKYVYGYVWTSSSSSSNSAGGGSYSGGFEQCSGTRTFSGYAYDARSGQAASSVTINSIQDARESYSGKSIKNCLSLGSSNATSTNTSGGGTATQGQLSAQVAFSSSCTYSGYYYLRFNVSYEGKQDTIDGGFSCKRLWFWPEIRPNGTSDYSWYISPTGIANVTFRNVQRTNGDYIGNASISFPTVTVWDWSRGGSKSLVYNASSAGNRKIFLGFATGSPPMNNNVSFLLQPGNFSYNGVQLTKWPLGYIDLQPRVCAANLSATPSDPTGEWVDGCDTNWGGFQIRAFDTWVENFGWGQSYVAGNNMSFVIAARTNISMARGANNITLKVGRPWEGELATPTYINATNLSDNWDKSSDWGYERWNVTFTIPVSLKKGGVEARITVNNSDGDEETTYLWFQIAKFSVSIPFEEQVIADYRDVVNSSDVNGALYATYGWNITNVYNRTGVRSISGKVCLKEQFNTSKYSWGWSEPKTYANGNFSKVMIVDANQSGVYNTIVINDSTSSAWTIRAAVLGLGTRNLSTVNATVGTTYLWSVSGCGMASIFNTSTATSNNWNRWAGEFQTSQAFYLPFVVSKGGTAQNGVTVRLNAVSKMPDGGGYMGYGFEKKVASSNYTTYSNVTDAAGVAIVELQVAETGMFSALWKVNSSTETDIADYGNDGLYFRTHAFSAEGGPLDWTNSQRVILNKTNASTVFGITPKDVHTYNGSFVEGNVSSFVIDTSTSTFYAIISNASAAASMAYFLDDDDNADLSTPSGNSPYNGPPITSYLNASLTFSNSSYDKTKIAIANWANVTPAGCTANSCDNIAVTFFRQEPKNWNTFNFNASTNPNTNISVYVCAYNFTYPKIPRANLTVHLATEAWDYMSSNTTWLTTFDAVTETRVTVGNITEPHAYEGIKTGPSGCAAFKATMPGGWPSNKWYNLRASIIDATSTNFADKESTWAGGVWTTLWG